jgi:hypothetical protein
MLALGMAVVNHPVSCRCLVSRVACNPTAGRGHNLKKTWHSAADAKGLKPRRGMMDVKTKAALSAFKSTAARFNQQDSTTEDLKQVEQELADSKIGIEFWDIEHDLVSKTVAYDDDEMPQGVPAGFDEYREVCHLGFAKINARWQLAVSDQIAWYSAQDCFEGSLETGSQALAQASRTIRVKAATSLSCLLEAFDNQVKKYLKDHEE